jgi:hypothetical protein
MVRLRVQHDAPDSTESFQYMHQRRIYRASSNIIKASRKAIRIMDTASQLDAESVLASSPPANEGGTTIARIVLSALAETRRLADGLNFSAVGGKE